MKSAYRTVCCVFLSGLVLVFENVSQAFVYNFENDFSITTNTDSSTWSYRWSDGFTRDGNYALLQFAHSELGWPYIPTWQRLTNDSYPFIGVSDLDGQSMIHPLGSPDGSAFAVVSWLSPFSGTVNIGLRITDLDPRTDGGGDGVTYYADNGSADGNLASGTIPNGGDTGFFWLSDVPVSVGDRLNFIIGPNANYYNDATRMFVEITNEAIPEPSTFALLALSATMVALRLYRRNM